MSMNEEILVNITPQETRVAVLAAGQVQELVVEREASRGLVGNIYVGRVARVLPGMQSAFVEIGLERAAFLHVADLWENRKAHENGKAEPGKPIEKMLAEGQPLTVHPAETIFMDHAGLDTYSSMWRARHVFGATHIVVVTQQFHLARAVWCGRALGMQAEGSAADRHVYRGIAWLQMREVISRTKAVFDVTVGRTPHHDGPPIDLGGDGRVTAG